MIWNWGIGEETPGVERTRLTWSWAGSPFVEHGPHRGRGRKRTGILHVGGGMELLGVYGFQLGLP